ncbi:unknown [Prevotella sp. CAG:924]|nr:unknown [Prevotella sp. CAG:924]
MAKSELLQANSNTLSSTVVLLKGVVRLFLRLLEYPEYKFIISEIKF